jgi:acetyl-CoA carboxylase carboxyl transferase subunit alpha
MLENACYSVISPEGCASILWKDSSKVREASRCLKMTAEDLLRLRVVERVFPESGGFDQVYATLKTELYRALRQKIALDTNVLLQRRYDRFRRMGARPER